MRARYIKDTQGHRIKLTRYINSWGLSKHPGEFILTKYNGHDYSTILSPAQAYRLRDAINQWLDKVGHVY